MERLDCYREYIPEFKTLIICIDDGMCYNFYSDPDGGHIGFMFGLPKWQQSLEEAFDIAVLNLAMF